jgi:dTDP-4-dehydrorhamnose 3,5-epimerase
LFRPTSLALQKAFYAASITSGPIRRENWSACSKVDIRRGSPHFGQWAGVMLTADNHRHFWIPEGFAHGFCVLSDFATFTYQCTAIYDAAADAGVRWNDADIGIDWLIGTPLLSDKDGKTPLLRDIDINRLPVFEP